MKISNRFAKSTVGRAFLFLAALLLTGLALAPGLADANGGGLANTPWPMFQHDQRHTGQSPYLGAQTNAIRWIFDAGQIIRGSPVIGSDGTIYFSCWNGSRFYALNPDGSVKWLRNTAYGGVGAPAIGSDGTIYFSDYGQMKAFNPDGSTKWTLNANGIRSSPVIADDGTIYAGANLAPDGGRLYAIRDNGSSGSVKWFYHTDGHINYSAPAIGNGGTIYIGTYDTDLYAITDNITNGVLKWRFNTGGLINSSPSIGSDGTIYVGSDDGALYAITDNVTNAVKKWHFGTGWSITSSPAIGSDGTIYVGCSAAAGFLYTLFAMNPDGSLKWAYDTGSDAETCSPAIGSDGTIYIGNGFGGRVWAISDNGTSGNLKWSYLTGDWVIGSPAIGSDGTVYIGSYDAKLYAFSSRPIITSANPSSGYQGTTLSNVIITGQNFTGATAVSFGAGITVNTFNVDGATQITANITIAADATPGTRDITVTIAEGPGTKINAFTVIQKGQNVYVNGATGNDSYDGLAAAWDSTHGPKKTIAGGIAAVTDNGTVNVAAGTYHEHGLHLSQTMNLVGAGALTTIIDGGANGNVLEVSSAPNQRNTISGFTIRNGAPAGPDPGG
ncbi:MAG: hypothetical protein FJZ88_02670, partial [Chloroflexi bacterium]|nr:hypothetical protein [Chloroflexota bacterium]